MKSIRHIGLTPASLPLSADDILEFHAARILLLLKFCGVTGRIDGLTKLAKLDFFVRYPEFFEIAKASVRPEPLVSEHQSGGSPDVESIMIRHHYGPWDKRYYHILAVLEAKALVYVVKDGRSFTLQLSKLGEQRVSALAAKSSFKDVILRMKDVKKIFGAKSGHYLKDMIYRLFDIEVARKPMGDNIF